MTTDYVIGMNDPRLRPRILRTVARDLLPDDKRPFPSSSDLSSILSYVKTHGILTERHFQPSDRKLIDEWRSAVDEWVDRLLSLVSSNMPDKCWAGICLLGVTCEECSSDRFLASYTLWFQKLLSNIQPPSSTHFVKVASCATLADLFTRLAVFSNLKKDATSLAGKLIQPILQLLNENGTESVWEGAINLLCTLITLFPSSMLRHYDSIETVIVSRIMSAKCTGNMSKKFANCLALLPKVRGDEDSWSLLMQKILISINMHIDDAFQGLEEATASQHMRLLVPLGKETPPPLGGHLMPEPSAQATTKIRELLVPRVSTLMHCCCIMLTNPYPVQVTVPIHLLLALVGRVLRVDGSLHGSLLQFTTAMQQELLCAELPVLHMDSLDLLIAVIKGVRSQFLPHAANVARLLTDYLRRASLPSIRIKVYSIMHILLISMGVGMALYLAQDIISNASVDLNDCPGSGSFSSPMCLSRLASEVSVQTPRRKRKHVSGWPMEQPENTDAGVDSLNRNMLTPLSVKIAALRALEALLTVGGSLSSESWRSNVDYLLITVATNACDAGWGIEGKGKCLNLVEGPPLSQGDFQLAALEALLASLLSPCRVRPPYLAQGLELFRRGKQETGTIVAAFCAHALLALEVLIHPRALPLVDAPVANNAANDEGFKQGHEKFNIPSFLLDDPRCIDDYENDDDLEETALNGLRIKKDTENTDQLLGSNKAASVEKDVVRAVRGDDIIEGRQNLVHSSDVEMTCTAGEENVEPNKESSMNMVDFRKTDVAIRSGSDLNRGSGATTNLVPAAFSRDDMEPGKGHLISSSSASLAKDGSNGFESLVAPEKENMLSYDSDSTSGSLPSIVDVDPDSDPDFA